MQNIINTLENEHKIIMLDHDDLYSALIKKNESPESSTRLKHMITSVEGKREPKDIRNFVNIIEKSRDQKI